MKNDGSLKIVFFAVALFLLTAILYVPLTIKDVMAEKKLKSQPEMPKNMDEVCPYFCENREPNKRMN